MFHAPNEDAVLCEVASLTSMNACEWVNVDLCCKALLVAYKTTKAHHKCSPFTIQPSQDKMLELNVSLNY